MVGFSSAESHLGKAFDHQWINNADSDSLLGQVAGKPEMISPGGFHDAVTVSGKLLHKSFYAFFVITELSVFVFFFFFVEQTDIKGKLTDVNAR